MVERQRAFFRAARRDAGRPGAPQTPVRWGELYATLIAHGHSPGDLARYTTRQLSLYWREALRREARASAYRIADVNAGMAGGKHANERIKALTQP